MKKLTDVELRGKKVVVRSDLNVALSDDGKTIDDGSKIESSLPTFKKILDDGAEILVILCHLGRPQGQVLFGLSCEVLLKDLSEGLGDKVVLLRTLEEMESVIDNSQANPGRVFLLENIRFWGQEERNDEKFGERIGRNFDVFVNDAFSVSHRSQASLTQIPKFTKEKCAGLLFVEELEKLTEVRDNPKEPALAVIGGAKIETKLPVIENLKKKYQKILVGGKIANEAIDEKKFEGDEKVVLPLDFGPEGKKEKRLDIGQETIEKFKQEIALAQTVIWNGPMGMFEEDDCAVGTKEIIQAIIERKEILQVVGGGETLEAVKKFANFSDFDYVSMSGGAMLDFLAGEKMPGLEALS